MIRVVSEQDVDTICKIYNYYIENTIITFEEKQVSVDEMKLRIADTKSQGYDWLVYEKESKVVGYAYASKWKTRSAYRFSVESSVYVKNGYQRNGIGRELYKDLLARLEKNGVHAVIAGISLPNESSVRFHESLGFQKVAQFPQVGLKFGKWINVGYWQLTMKFY
jgi:phosphinothricin acetyltransferase